MQSSTIEYNFSLDLDVNVNAKLMIMLNIQIYLKGEATIKDITEVAKIYGVSTRTIRYYEELGLLQPDRTEGNKRIYSKAESVKLQLIFRGKRYGFTLDEIKEMILLFDKDRTGRKQLERTIEFGHEKIDQVEAKIQELTDMKAEMEQLLAGFTNKLNDLKGE
ncbi:MerR family DNA-binding transcriptional regulator [Sporosarcina sp. FSL K6-2383]|uniref:MerR family transcriptional regulator n=1 Tax=Sporosarcina sp. FSL K6-2383 TaxID=2921556 RepID=UPI00315A92FC